jgi:DNA-directed RNA polymerase subunit RPC12/RpoP
MHVTLRRLPHWREHGFAVKPKVYRYLIQYACFECRKVFKRPYIVGELEHSAWLSCRISGQKPAKPFAAPSYRCPDCGEKTSLMGRAFRAPRQDDVDRWRAVEVLVRGGYTFWSHVGRMPETLGEARKYIEQHRRISEGEELVRKIRHKAGQSAP